MQANIQLGSSDVGRVQRSVDVVTQLEHVPNMHSVHHGIEVRRSSTIVNACKITYLALVGSRAMFSA